VAQHFNLAEDLKCPRNIYNLCVSYFNERSASLLLNGSIEQRKISKG
jgi:hypothetical protein